MSMPSKPASDYVSLARLERALAVVAYVVLRHGPVYAPILERLEQEVAAARRGDPTIRAQAILAAYTDVGGRKAMRLSHSRFCSSEGPSP
jgi:hypothetical protein